MIFGIDTGIVLLIAYFVIGACGLGVWWELQDEETRAASDLMDEGAIPIAVFWGVITVVGAVIGIFWLLR